MPDYAVISNLLGEKVIHNRPLAGGDIADVLELITAKGNKYVIKCTRAGQNDTSTIEAKMLKTLKDNSALPVPEVIAQQNGLLLMEYIEHDGGLMKGSSAINGARHVAALHKVQAEKYGLDYDTVIGPLSQKNTLENNWLSFYAEHRLMDMANRAVQSGKLSVAIMKRIEIFTQKLGDFIPRTPKASLLHGDLWGGNILVNGERVAGFIDPAIYYGHAEMDLAFLTLFNSAGDDFFAAYNEINPIGAGFFEERRDIYNLWPLLVHVRLFGGAYVGSVATILRKFGV